ncbi:CDP-alcohol phosphatidyltransferase family protein [Pikeienuella piscinae]|uniref:CDP-alcohol phosphatidyltransferase family protein n=1 Tax=Pikeienuella piscinae TaxID=2748098 RepID=A0A7L5C1L4_9RHOB|nr:CDP-alcohol phosphatidyltransferase family protein [Pikeienuella piscinae]QIE56044.1 CDP-alcohol phosphatidyltransferase family protein [Pikeienuella piscinae]
MPATRQTAFIAGESAARVFGLTPRERLTRQALQAGVDITSDPAEAGVILSGAHVYGAGVISALASAAPGTALSDNTGAFAGSRTVDGARDAARIAAGAAAPAGALSGAGLAGRYDKALRKRADPMTNRVIAGEEKPAEQEIFDATYKGVTDFVTKHVWPVPALAAVRFCVRFGITPNQVTLASLALVLLTFWLFWTGSFAIGVVVAWAMTFLDTVDGKLARATLTSSRFGDVLDHGIDLIHPPFWWWAWWVGLGGTDAGLNDGGLALGVILAGYVLQRVMEGIFIARFGIHMHIWRPFDSFFRKITARRNPNLAILTVAVLLGAPDAGFVAVALWVFVGLIVHGAQIAQGLFAAKRGPITSWLAED